MMILLTISTLMILYSSESIQSSYTQTCLFFPKISKEKKNLFLRVYSSIVYFHFHIRLKSLYIQTLDKDVENLEELNLTRITLLLVFLYCIIVESEMAVMFVKFDAANNFTGHVKMVIRSLIEELNFEYE